MSLEDITPVVDIHELPTNILGMKEDDEARTSYMVSMASSDSRFQQMWGDDSNYAGQDRLRNDVFFHYKNKDHAAEAIQVTEYRLLSREQEMAGTIGRTLIGAEKLVRRLGNGAVRRAIKSGLLEK